MNNGQMLVTPAQTLPVQALPDVVASVGVGEQAGEHFAGVLDGLKQKVFSRTEAASQLPNPAEHLVESHGLAVVAVPQQDIVSAQSVSSAQTEQAADGRASDVFVSAPAEVTAKMVMAAYHQPIEVPEEVIIPETAVVQHTVEVMTTAPLPDLFGIATDPQQLQQGLLKSVVVTTSSPETALVTERHVEQPLFSPMHQEPVVVPEKPVVQPAEPTQAAGSDQAETLSSLQNAAVILTPPPPQAVSMSQSVSDAPKIVLNTVAEREHVESVAVKDTRQIATVSRAPEDSLAAMLPQEKQPVVLPRPVAAPQVIAENPIAEHLEPVMAQPTVSHDSGAVVEVHQEVTPGVAKKVTPAQPEQPPNGLVSGEYVTAPAEVTARMVMAAYQQLMSITEVVRSSEPAAEEVIEVTPIAPQVGNFGIAPDVATLQQGNQQQKITVNTVQHAGSATPIEPSSINVVVEQGEHHVEQPRSATVAQKSVTMPEASVALTEKLVPTRLNEQREPAISAGHDAAGMVPSQIQPTIASHVSVPTPHVVELQAAPTQPAEFVHATSTTQPSVATPVQAAVFPTAPVVPQISEIRVEKQAAYAVESVQFVNNEQPVSVDYQKTAAAVQMGTPESVQVAPRVVTASLTVPVEPEMVRAVVPSEKTEPVAAAPTQQFVDVPPVVVMSEKPATHSAEPVQSVSVRPKVTAEPMQVSPSVASIPQVVSAEPAMARTVVPSEKVEPVAATPTQQIVDVPPVAMSEKPATHSAEPVQSVSVQPKVAAEPVSPQAMPVEPEIVRSSVEVRNAVEQSVDVAVPQAANAVQQPATTSVAGLQESRPVVPQVAVELPEASLTETAQQAPQVSQSQSSIEDLHQKPAVERATVVASRQMPETLPAPEALTAHIETAPLRTADVSRASLSSTDNLQNADKSSPKPVTTDSQLRVATQRMVEIAELDLQLAQARPIATKGAVELVPAISARGTAMVMPEARSGRALLGRQQLFDNNRLTGEQSAGKELGSSGSVDLFADKIIAEAVTAIAGNEEQKMEEGLVDKQPQAHNFGGVLNQEHQKTSAVSGKIPVTEAVRQEVPDQIMQQVKDRLVQHDLKPGNQQITLTLAPDTLGELKMNLNLQGQKLSVEIITENRTVRDAIAQHTETLKDSLAKQNIAMESFDVTTGGKGSGGQGQQNQSAWRELVKQQQQQQFWTMPRGYTARADTPTVPVPQKPQGHAMLDIHY